MTTGMPELGSKISLISKADIRYEGRLFTVDPQECTIALASVRSFGTEDRETQYPVPAQNQVYDYILFRGSDIKDIRVVNNVTHPQPLNDPAIMQLSVPPTLGAQQFQSHPVLGHMGAQMGQFGPPYGALGAMGGLGAGMAPGMGIQSAPAGLRTSKPTSVLDLIGGGTRSTTPASLGSRKSPTIDQAVQAGGSKSDNKKVVRPIQPPGQRNQQRNKSRERRDSSRGDNQQDHRQQDHRQQHPNQNSRLPNRNQQQSNHQSSSQGGGFQHHNQSNYHHHNQSGYQGNQHQQTRGSWSNRGAMRSRGRGRGGYKPNQGQLAQGNRKSTLKFENDYDFEQANTEFEELKNKLSKVKLDDVVCTKPEINGDTDKKDDSGNETGAGETEQEEEHEVYYDKSKSFFDKISCEAVERAKGKSQRTDWRTERKLNSETFGVAATRRGNYRGRGGFRGMGYRGGYRTGYRQSQRRDNNQQQQLSSQQQQGNNMERNESIDRTNDWDDVTVAQSETSNTNEIGEKEPPNVVHEVTGGIVIPPGCVSGLKVGGIPEPAMAVRQ